MTDREAGRRGRRRRRESDATAPVERAVNYRHLINPFEPVPVYSDDQIEQIHQTALRVLEELGVKILLPAARNLLREGGIDVDEASMMARFDREIVQGAIASAPSEIPFAGGDADSSLTWGGRQVTWCPVGGAPHISDLDEGKRPGTLEATENIIRLACFRHAGKRACCLCQRPARALRRYSLALLNAIRFQLRRCPVGL